MSKPSKRDIERQHRLEQLRRQIETGAEAGDVAPAVTVAPSLDQHAEQRARGAAPERMLKHLGSAMADNLRMLQQARDELQDQLVKLTSGDAQRVISIDPATARPSRFPNRIAKATSDEDESFRKLKAEIAHTGTNLVPALVRPLEQAEGDFIYEVVYGHRRHASCLQLGLPFRVIVSSMSDVEAARLQFAENLLREDLSVIELGRVLNSHLEVFRTKGGAGRLAAGALDKFAEWLNVGKRYIQNLHLIGQIPDSVLGYLDDVRNIPYADALKLARECKDNLDAVLSRCQTLDPATPDRSKVKHMVGVVASVKRTPKVSFMLPDDMNVRKALVKELRELEQKYGILILPGDMVADE